HPHYSALLPYPTLFRSRRRPRRLGASDDEGRPMIAAARARLHQLLTTEAAFVAEMAALKLGADNSGATPQVRSGNRPFAQIHQGEYPCWIDDAGEQEGAGCGA